MGDSTSSNKPKTVRQLDLGLATFVAPEGASSTSQGSTASALASGPPGLGEDVLRAIKAVKLSPHLGGSPFLSEEVQALSREECGQQELESLSNEDKPELQQSVHVEHAQPVRGHSEYEALVKLSAWKDLGLLCEGRMNSNPRDIEARLWWVKSQLAGSGVPVSMLTAPLDSASKELLEKGEAVQEMAPKLYSDMSILAGTLLIEMADLSMSKGDDLVALTLFERAHCLGADAKHKLFNAITATRERIARGRKTPKEEQIMVRLAELEASIGPVSRFGDGSKNKDLKSSKIAGPASFSPGRATASATTHRSARSRPRWWLALALILGLVGGVVFLFPGILSFSSTPLVVPVALLEDIRGSMPRLPSVSSATQPGNLDAILYEIDSHGQKADKPDRSGSVTNGQKSVQAYEGEKNADGQKDINASASATTPEVSNKPRETVNTTSPVEPPTVDDRSGKRRERDDSISPRRPKSNRSDSVVEEYSPGRLYRVIVPTRAMAGPTLRGRALTELDVDDRIMVEARLGVWLKIRSKKGQIAYILAQDAHEAGDSGQP